MIWRDHFADAEADYFVSQRYFINDEGWQLVENGVVVSSLGADSIPFTRVAGQPLQCDVGDGVWFYDQLGQLPADVVFARVWLTLEEFSFPSPENNNIDVGFQNHPEPFATSAAVSLAGNNGDFPGQFAIDTLASDGAFADEAYPMGSTLQLELRYEASGGEARWTGDGGSGTRTLSGSVAALAGFYPNVVLLGPFSSASCVVSEFGWEWRTAGVAPGAVEAFFAQLGGIRKRRSRIVGALSPSQANLDPGSTVAGGGHPNQPNALSAAGESAASTADAGLARS